MRIPIDFRKIGIVEQMIKDINPQGSMQRNVFVYLAVIKPDYSQTNKNIAMDLTYFAIFYLIWLLEPLEVEGK